jgi:hypothetical protein
MTRAALVNIVVAAWVIAAVLITALIVLRGRPMTARNRRKVSDPDCELARRVWPILSLGWRRRWWSETDYGDRPEASAELDAALHQPGAYANSCGRSFQITSGQGSKGICTSASVISSAERGNCNSIKKGATTMPDTKEPNLKLVGNPEEAAAPSTKPPEYNPPADATDLSGLWLDTKLGDGLTNTRLHSVPVGKPRSFFRVIADERYRRLVEIYVHKIEGQVEEQHYLIDRPMHGVIEEARRATLVTCFFRDGSLGLWALKLPKEGEKDNEAWMSARAAAKVAMDRWVKLLWQRRSYLTRDAQPGYAPDPDLEKIPPFNELVRLAFGDHGIIRDHDHPIVKDLFGHAQKPDGEDGLS